MTERIIIITVGILAGSTGVLLGMLLVYKRYRMIKQLLEESILLEERKLVEDIKTISPDELILTNAGRELFILERIQSTDLSQSEKEDLQVLVMEVLELITKKELAKESERRLARGLRDIMRISPDMFDLIANIVSVRENLSIDVNSDIWKT